MNGPIRYRLFRSLQAKGTGDTIAVVRAKPAIPATTHVWLFSSQGERQAGKACPAAGAAGNNGVIRPPLVGVEGIGVHSVTCSPAELSVEGLAVGLVDQCAKLGLAASEEVWETHGVVLQLSADVRPPMGLG